MAMKRKIANINHFYIPKRVVHNWSGHRKGITQFLIHMNICFSLYVWIIRLRFEMCINLVYKALQGSHQAVRVMRFSNDVTSFLAGLDHNIRSWDTYACQVFSVEKNNFISLSDNVCFIFSCFVMFFSSVMSVTKQKSLCRKPKQCR